MGSQHIEEVIPTKIYGFIALVALAGCLFGYEMSDIAEAKVLICSDPVFGCDDKNHPGLYGLLASAVAIGAIAGSATSGFLQDGLGRRTTIIIACLTYIAGTAVEAFSNHYGILILGRITVGVCVGVFSGTVPLYIAELSPSKLRGSLVTTNQLMVVVGITLGYTSGRFLNKAPHGWRWMLGLGSPVALLLALCFATVTPRSPRWLAAQGHTEQALVVLGHIRATEPPHLVDALSRAELRAIEESIARSARGASKLREPHVAYALAVGVMVSVIQQITGVNAINSYAPEILQACGFSGEDANTQAILIGLFKIVFVVVAFLLMDRAGRKLLLLVGTGIMAASILVVAIILNAHPDPSTLSKAGAYGAATSLFTYMAAFELGLGPIAWLLLSEMYPLSVRGIAMSIGGTSNWVFTYIVQQTYPLLQQWLGVGGTFFLYFAMCTLSLGLIAFLVPETKGKTLEDMEDMFRDRMYGVGQWQKRSMAGEEEDRETMEEGLLTDYDLYARTSNHDPPLTPGAVAQVAVGVN